MSTQTTYLQFASPTALWLLAALPLLTWLSWRALRKRREAIEIFASPALADRLIVGLLKEGAGARSALLIVVFGLLIIAAARPKLGMRLERVERRGADILVAVDTSDSMLAQDALPSRLEAAKREIMGLISRLQGDRIGLITFSTEAFLYCPLTCDYDAAALFVESIDEHITSGAGTALASALEEAGRAFTAGEGGEQVLVLVSDGEDWGRGAIEQARSLRQRGVRIYAIGIGGTEGAPVPQYDTEGRMVGTLRHEGKVVVSRLNEQALRELATVGNGKYFKGGTADHGAAAVYNHLTTLEAGRTGHYTFRTYAERFQWPLGAALLLMGAEFVMRIRPRRWPRLRLMPRGLLLLGLCCLLLGSGFSLFLTAAMLCRSANRLFHEGKFAEALRKYTRALDLEPGNPLLEFNAGDALYRQAQYEQARERFAKAAAADLRLAGHAHYNTGNSYLSEGNLEAAIEEYKNALRCNPSDSLAKRNLEIALRRKQQQNQQDKQRQDNEERKNKQEQRDQTRQERQGPQKQQQRQQPRQDKQQAHPQQQGSATPMSPEEARALLRQAEYEDAQLRREIVRAMPQSTQSTGKNW
ncbi:MAG: VWA domain-containing protein [Candidatus Zipacnadales bacterium]